MQLGSEMVMQKILSVIIVLGKSSKGLPISVKIDTEIVKNKYIFDIFYFVLIYLIFFTLFFRLFYYISLYLKRFILFCPILFFFYCY